MGVAAYNRGTALIRAQCASQSRDAELDAMIQRALQDAVDCDEFTRAIQSYLVSAKGMRGATIERQKAKKMWQTKLDALALSHCEWVNTDHTNLFAYHAAAIKRARAAYELLTFALGSWELPLHLQPPRIINK